MTNWNGEKKDLLVTTQLSDEEMAEVKRFARRRRLTPEAAAKILFKKGQKANDKNKGAI